MVLRGSLHGVDMLELSTAGPRLQPADKAEGFQRPGCPQILTEMVSAHQTRRKAVTDEVVQRFTAVRQMNCC